MSVHMSPCVPVCPRVSPCVPVCPDVRATAAKALGNLVKGMGEDEMGDLVPWLLTTGTTAHHITSHHITLHFPSSTDYTLIVYLINAHTT